MMKEYHMIVHGVNCKTVDLSPLFHIDPRAALILAHLGYKGFLVFSKANDSCSQQC